MSDASPDATVIPFGPKIPDCCVADQADDDYALIASHGVLRVCCAHCLDDVFDATNVPQFRLDKMEKL